MDPAATTTTTATSYAEDDHEVMSQTMGRRRPTIRDIAAGGSTSSSCLTVKQQYQHSRHHPPQPSTSHATSSPHWFVDASSTEELEPPSPSPGQHPHFLDDCRMCGRYLSRDRDVYMYKGDTPFCSEECRDEQIQMDEAMERSRRRRRAVGTNRQVVDKCEEGNAAAAVVAVGAV